VRTSFHRERALVGHAHRDLASRHRAELAEATGKTL
jgi:hypothetical protein